MKFIGQCKSMGAQQASRAVLMLARWQGSQPEVAALQRYTSERVCQGGHWSSEVSQPAGRRKPMMSWHTI